MRTREKILETARRMFNEHGIDNTSAKMIAAEMGISDGNLRYHFRTKEDLVYGLYMQLVEGFNRQFTPYDQGDLPGLGEIYQTLHSVFARLYEHRYLMADFITIMRKYPKIEQHYRELIQQRKQQFRRVLQVLMSGGILKVDIPEQQYEKMIEQFYILSDAWIGHAEVFLKEAGHAQRVKHYANLIFSMIAPYLTEKGREEYESLLNKD